MTSAWKDNAITIVGVLTIVVVGLAAIWGFVWLLSFLPWPEGLTEPRCKDA